MELGVTRVAGFAAAFALPVGEAEISGAINDTNGQTHWLGGAGYRYLSPKTSATLRWDEADQGFRLAGVVDPLMMIQHLVTATASQQLTPGMSLNLGWIEQRSASGHTQRSANAGLAWSLPGGATSLLSVARVSQSQSSSDSLRLTLTLPLGADRFATASVDGGTVRQNTISVQRSLPFSEGIGYRLSASDGSIGTRGEASVRAQSRTVLLSAETSMFQDQPGYSRFGARGSLGTLGGAVFAARSIDDSFALVQAPGVANVPIQPNGQPAGRTDSKGRLVLPRVAGLVPQRVEAEVDALDPEVAVLEERAAFVAAPRSAVIATLGLKRVSSALIRAVRPDGSVLSAGAPVQGRGDVETSSVGPRGEIFVRARPGPQQLSVEHEGVVRGLTSSFLNHCRLAVSTKPARFDASPPRPDGYFFRVLATSGGYSTGAGGVFASGASHELRYCRCAGWAAHGSYARQHRDHLQQRGFWRNRLGASHLRLFGRQR